MKPGVLDLVLGTLALLLVLRGFVRGFVREFFSVAQWVLGLVAAFLFSGPVSLWIARRWFPGAETLPRILAFAGIFIAVFAVTLILEKILRDIVEGVNLGGPDRFLGAVFGLVEGLAAGCVIILLLEIQPFFDLRKLLAESVLAGFLSPLIGPIMGTVRETVSDAIAKGAFAGGVTVPSAGAFGGSFREAPLV